MSGQAPDEVLFEASWWAVTAVDGAGLFDPTAHGLDPRPKGTACYRGYVCRYALVDGRLALRELELGSQDEPPRLAGVEPGRDDDWLGWRYQELDVPVAFTGRLLVGDGDTDGPYLNMGFLPAWMYAEVRDLTFQAGTLVDAADRSAELAAVRADFAETAARPPAGEASRDWISRTFSLTYDYSWPGR
ncbi:hypothetical protein GCM10022251_09620 [Phytohabitans flavus]|uniref:Uncharacterized protein n=1 Tax=Phytohabitans flavus TaxID=1076124 RepID=A0A6F8XKB1_9ACTN|nr:hypothetical protein [Phytohabitans flavus]BCB74243.1 hypothetical protein Pflav_006530 [Phytohabitans flavus]